jgi:hypothetical protein
MFARFPYGVLTMTRKSLRHKRLGGIAHKQMGATKRALGVTACGKRIDPWIVLANSIFEIGPTPSVIAEYTMRENPSAELRNYAKERPAACEQLAYVALATFSHIVAAPMFRALAIGNDTFVQATAVSAKRNEAIASGKPMRASEMPVTVPSPALFQEFIVIDSQADGTVRAGINPMLTAFLEALSGLEVSRIRSCEQCGKRPDGNKGLGRFFYAGRSTYQGRATLLGCSKACTHALRMARWRVESSKYHKNRERNERARKFQKQKRGKNRG